MKKINLITKSNVLCRASWSPDSIWEARLVALIASKVNKDDNDFNTYEFYVNEIIDDSNNSGNVYDILYKTAKKAMSRVIEVRNGKNWILYNLFSKCEYISSKGLLTLSIHPDLKPHYLNLKNKFTRYSLEHFMILPSSYSQRMFEILKSWDDVNDVTIELSELKKMLVTPESINRNFKDFRNRVLNKAHKDIHAYTDLKFEWESIKKGRKVVKIRFMFSDRKIKESVVKKPVKKRPKSSNNNAIVVESVECYAKHKDGCKQHKNKAVCNYCKEFNQC